MEKITNKGLSKLQIFALILYVINLIMFAIALSAVVYDYLGMFASIMSFLFVNFIYYKIFKILDKSIEKENFKTKLINDPIYYRNKLNELLTEAVTNNITMIIRNKTNNTATINFKNDIDECASIELIKEIN